MGGSRSQEDGADHQFSSRLTFEKLAAFWSPSHELRIMTRSARSRSGARRTVARREWTHGRGRWPASAKQGAHRLAGCGPARRCRSRTPRPGDRAFADARVRGHGRHSRRSRPCATLPSGSTLAGTDEVGDRAASCPQGSMPLPPPGRTLVRARARARRRGLSVAVAPRTAGRAFGEPNVARARCSPGRRRCTARGRRARTTREACTRRGVEGRRFVVVDTGGLEVAPATRSRSRSSSRPARDQRGGRVVFQVDAVRARPAERDAAECCGARPKPVLVAATRPTTRSGAGGRVLRLRLGERSRSAQPGRGVRTCSTRRFGALPPRATRRSPQGPRGRRPRLGQGDGPRRPDPTSSAMRQPRTTRGRTERRRRGRRGRRDRRGGRLGTWDAAMAARTTATRDRRSGRPSGMSSLSTAVGETHDRLETRKPRGRHRHHDPGAAARSC